MSKDLEIEAIILQMDVIARKMIKNYAKIVNIKPQANSFQNHDLFSDDETFNGDKILEELDGLNELFTSINNRNHFEFARNFKSYELFFDLIIIEFQSLFTILFFHFNNDENKFEGFEKESFTFKSVRLLCYLLNTLINNSISMKILIKDGFNFQVNLIFRNSIEIMDVCFASITNEVFYENYVLQPDSEHDIKKKWINVRPSNIDKIIKDEFNKISELQEYWNILRETKESLYRKTSSFVHGNSVRIFQNTFSEKINDDDNLTVNQFGLISKDLKESFFELIIYSKLFLDSIIILLVNNHKLAFNRFGEEGKYHIYLSCVNKYYLKDLIKEHYY